MKYNCKKTRLLLGTGSRLITHNLRNNELWLNHYRNGREKYQLQNYK